MLVSESPVHSRKNIYGWIGLTVLAIAQLLLLKGVEPVASWFYYFAWWPYIVVTDSLIYRIKGNSLLMNRRGELIALLFWSVIIWTFFEAVNLVLKNWYYVNVEPMRLIRWPGYALAYATVLPGLFETFELLEALGLFKRIRVKPRSISVPLLWTLFLLGLLSLVLVFLLPHYCHPLLWCALIFLLEPVNYRRGVKSLLRDWEEGSLRTLSLLLTAGFICGILWEFWNFWAVTKWIYTVPFFEELKLFEMPLLGFLGFPPFAVECYSIYNFISIFRHGRCWQEDSYGLNRHKKVHSAVRILTVTVGFFFCAITFRAMDSMTVNSFSSSITDLQCVSPETARRLLACGIRTPKMLVDESSSPAGLETLAKRLSAPASYIESLRNCAELAHLKGIGTWNANLLMRAGIKDITGLAASDPSMLFQRLLREYDRLHEKQSAPPREAIVRIWIREAQKKTGA